MKTTQIGRTITAREQKTNEAELFTLKIRRTTGEVISRPLLDPVPEPPDETAVKAIVITPASVAVKVGESAAVSYQLIGDDDQPIDDDRPVTHGVTFESVAAFDGETVTGKAAGVTSVWFECEGVRSSIPVTVTAADVPVPPQPGTGTNRPSTMAGLLGPIFNYPAAMTKAGPVKIWAQRWQDPTYTGTYRLLEPTRWAAVGATWSLANYYDRAGINYGFGIATGDATLLQHAHALAIDYRTWVLSSLPAGGPAAHWMMPDGIAAHFMATGDTESRRTVGIMADIFTGLTYRDRLSLPQCDNRLQAYYLKTVLDAWAIDAPSAGVGSPLGLPGGKDWPTELRTALELIMAGRYPDLVWYAKLTVNDPILPDGTPITHPFTLGLLMDALARYYDLFERDARIIPSLRACCDHLWTVWRPADKAFPYFPASTIDDGDPAPRSLNGAPDVNMLIVRGFSWIAKKTGDLKYRAMAEQIIEGAVLGAWLSPDKQINESYSSGFRALADLE